MARLKWFFEKTVDIAVDVVAGILLYLIVGGYVTGSLMQVSPYLPVILIVSLSIAIVAGLSYRTFRSVTFHRYVESTNTELIDFLHKWDDLNNACVTAINQQNSQQSITHFDNIRTELLYKYPKISKAVKTQRYNLIDNWRGVAIRNYDIIGNLLATSPFTRMKWFNADYEYQDFRENWDRGRTILVSTIGLFDCIRQGTLHIIYFNLRLVPFPKKQKEKE